MKATKTDIIKALALGTVWYVSVWGVSYGLFYLISFNPEINTTFQHASICALVCMVFNAVFNAITRRN